NDMRAERGDGEIGLGRPGGLAADRIGEAADRLPRKVAPAHVEELANQGQAKSCGHLGDRVADIVHRKERQPGLEPEPADNEASSVPRWSGSPTAVMVSTTRCVIADVSPPAS